VVYGTVRSTFTGKPDDCVQDGAIFCVSSMCCLAPALGAINRYEMREKYNIVGLHASETAGAKKYFDGKSNNEVLGKKDGHGFISVFPFPVVCGVDGRIWLLGIVVVFVLSVRKREKLTTWLILENSKGSQLTNAARRVALGMDVWLIDLIWFWGFGDAVPLGSNNIHLNSSFVHLS
jgi:hypothetical protein